MQVLLERCFVVYSVRRETGIVLKHLQNLAAHMVRKTLPASRQLGSTWHIAPLPNDYISTGQSEGKYCQIATKPTLLLWLYIFIYASMSTDRRRAQLLTRWTHGRKSLCPLRFLASPDSQSVDSGENCGKIDVECIFFDVSFHVPLLCFKIVAENLGEWYPPMSETVQRPVCLVCLFTRAFRWLSLGDCQD